jgi:outer membrane protein OmpA-like peptidoglycan-associated protein
MSKNTFDSSMTDLMISLVILFLLIIAVVIMQFSEVKTAPVKKRNALIEELRIELNAKTKELHIPGLVIEKVQDDPLALEIRVSESDLKFDFNSDKLNNNNKVFISEIMPVLVNVLKRHESEIDFVTIAGYTDKNGGNNGMGNILLSQSRALAVLNYSLANVFNTPDDTNRLFLIDKASIRGYGSLNKYLLTTDELSRRVVIKVRIKSLDLYNEIKLKSI